MKKDAAVGFHIQEDNTESKLNEFLINVGMHQLNQFNGKIIIYYLCVTQMYSNYIMPVIVTNTHRKMYANLFIASKGKIIYSY